MLKERWEWIKGYEGLYQISDYGRVMSYYNNRHGIKEIGELRSLVKNKHGYYQIYFNLNNNHKAFYIARLVASHFVSNPENKPQVNHKDGVHNNNFYTNLEWVTPSENRLHSHRILYNCGNNSKLTWEKAREIRELYKTERYTQKQLGNMFMVTRPCISRLVSNKTWKGGVSRVS